MFACVPVKLALTTRINFPGVASGKKPRLVLKERNKPSPRDYAYVSWLIWPVRAMTLTLLLADVASFTANICSGNSIWLRNKFVRSFVLHFGKHRVENLFIFDEVKMVTLSRRKENTNL